MSRVRFVALLLALITLLVYLPAGWCEFLNYDDPDYVTDNAFVKSGLTLAGIKWAFVTGHAANWHPLTWLSLMLDAELFGLNATAFHFVNVLFHAADTVLLFVLLLRLTDKFWPCAMIAALFAWHPLHVESVAWVAERKDVLSAFFGLLALLSYVRYAQARASIEGQASKAGLVLPAFDARRSTLDYFLALFFFALGLMAKPMLVTLPFILLLLDFWPLARLNFSSSGKLLLEKIPFFVLTLASCIVTFLAQRHGHAVLTLTQVPFGFRLENALVAVLRYMAKLLWPTKMAIIYPLSPVPIFQLALAIALLILISALAWRWRKTRPYFLFGWLWFLGTLIPVIGLVQVGVQALADRYTYIPSIGFFTAVIFLANDVVAGIKIPKIFPVTAAGILLACILVTEHQLRFWRTNEALFRHALAVTQNNDIAHLNIGYELELRGDIAGALAEYRKTLSINPNHPELHNNLGLILDKMNRHAEALAEYRIALNLNPQNAFRHNAVGCELAALHQFSDALKEFAAAKRLDPKYAAPCLETGKIYFQLGRDAEAVREFQTAARLDPDNFQTLAIVAHYFAANANAAARKPQTALTLAAKADDLSNHNQPMVLDILGMAYAANGDFANAQACAQNALDLAAALQMETTNQIRRRLELYKKNQPWRESFLATNAAAEENRETH